MIREARPIPALPLHPPDPPPAPPLTHLIPSSLRPPHPRDDAERLAEAKRMLREADANGDGKISRSEFSALLRENVAPDSLSLYDSRLRLPSPGSPAGGVLAPQAPPAALLATA